MRRVLPKDINLSQKVRRNQFITYPTPIPDHFPDHFPDF